LKPRYPNLDLLRLALALEVFVLHTQAYDNGRVLWLPVHPVAAFVCISGLLIPQSFSASTGWPHFVWKRLLRILPALLIAHAIVLSIWGPRAVAGAFVFYVTAGLFGSPDYDSPLWSLAVEEVLYVAHAIMRLTRKAWRVETAALLFVVSCALYGRFAGGNPNAERYFRLFASFFLGNVISFHRQRLQRANPYWVVVVFAAALCVANWGGLSPMLYMFTDSVVCGSVVVFALATPQVRFNVHDISYGTYVYHAPFLGLFAGKGLHGLALWLAAVPTVLCVATASWFLIERPLLRFKNVFVRAEPVELAKVAGGRGG
jgi:peptidoglycan/LPS O-acetylase OafA/YrhL